MCMLVSIYVYKLMVCKSEMEVDMTKVRRRTLEKAERWSRKGRQKLHLSKYKGIRNKSGEKESEV